MKRMLAIICLFPALLLAQEFELRDGERVSPSAVEIMLDEITADREESLLQEDIAELIDRPVDLNRGTLTELQRIPGVSPVIAYRIVRRREDRSFESVDDLLGIDGVTVNLLSEIRPFVAVEPVERVLSGKIRFRGQGGLQPRRGDLERRFLGSRLKLYHRFSFSSVPDRLTPADVTGRIDGSFVLEKDSGEPVRNGHAAGFLMCGIPILSGNLVIGNYRISPGTSGAAPVSRGYSSTGEAGYFQGLGLDGVVGGVRFFAFYSNKSVHASLSDSGAIVSFDETGLFRTIADEGVWRSARERVAGASITVSLLRGLQLTAKARATRYDRLLALRRPGSFRGRSLTAFGLVIGYSDDDRNFDAEVGWDRFGATAAEARVHETFHERLSLAVTGWAHPRSFPGPNTRPMTGSGITENERGVVASLKSVLTSRCDLMVIYRLEQKLQRSGQIPFSSSREEILCITEISAGGNLRFEVAYRARVNTEEVKVLDGFQRFRYGTGVSNRKGVRVGMIVSPRKTLQWKTKFEMTWVVTPEGPREKGLLMSQSLRWHPWSWAQVDGRFSVYETASFNSRLYEFEQDVAGTFANPALYGKGMRAYVVCSVAFMEGMRISGKYGVMMREGAKTLGSGLDEITGDSKTSVSLQIDASF